MLRGRVDDVSGVYARACVGAVLPPRCVDGVRNYIRGKGYPLNL